MQVQSSTQTSQSASLNNASLSGVSLSGVSSGKATLSNASQTLAFNSPISQAKPPLTSPSPASPPPALNQSPSVGQTAAKPNTAQTTYSEVDSKVKLGKGKNLNSKKQIPTILGLLILFVALVAGVLLFGQGTGVFSPRATAETTPKNILISNVTDKTFTISFYTDESTVAFVKYGVDSKSLDKQASDDRDQLSGVVKDYHLHHITLRGLEPSTSYFYTLGTGSSSFDNNGQPYTITTAAKPSQSPSNNQTIYGNVFNADGSPAEGAVVYIYSEGMGVLSSLVKSSGSWGISLANAFNTEKNGYLTMTDETPIEIKVQGTNIDLLTSLQTTVALAQPTANLILTQNGSSVASASATSNLPEVDKAELLADNSASPTADLAEITESSTASGATPIDTAASSAAQADSSVTTDDTTDTELPNSSGALRDLLTESTDNSASETIAETPTPATQEVLNLNELNENQAASDTVVTTNQPQIKVNLPANTTVRIVVHSDTNIDQTLQTDANGDVILDLASLGENLDPGEHTASYTYTDPATGEEVTKTYSFTVDPTTTRQLATVADLDMANQLTPTPTPTKIITPIPSIPYGSGNPYVPTEPVTATATSTRSAVVATDSGQYDSGSVGTTLVLLLGGLFFVLAGTWSYFLATSFEQKKDK
ncbi:MAG TPA: fibronectin type III domain-containing protein [Candidatus Woesebacteria bacterium]|nr:fibronectin type III domain-containing protein [Candidatus Woesebacteria bacterium]